MTSIVVRSQINWPGLEKRDHGCLRPHVHKPQLLPPYCALNLFSLIICSGNSCYCFSPALALARTQSLLTIPPTHGLLVNSIAWHERRWNWIFFHCECPTLWWRIGRTRSAMFNDKLHRLCWAKHKLLNNLLKFISGPPIFWPANDWSRKRGKEEMAWRSVGWQKERLCACVRQPWWIMHI